MRKEKLIDITTINPRFQRNLVPDLETTVSFVPMAAVSEKTRAIVAEQEKTLAEVSNGFTYFQNNDVLVAKITPCFENGKMALAEIQNNHGFGSTEFHVIRPQRNLLDSRYLFHFLQQDSIRYEGERKMTGSAGQKRVPKTFFESLEIPLPPLEEQKRIAAVLDKADEVRAKRRVALEKLDSLLQSVFLDMFGDPVSNPKGWEKVEFEKVCDTKLGKMLDEKKQAQTNQRPYLRNANVQWNYVNTTSVFEMYFDEREQQLFRLKYGDLLICEGGEVGRTAIWRNEIPECYYQKAIHRGRPKTDKATSEYLLFLMLYLAKSGGLKNHVTVATIPHLTSEKLKSLRIPLPPIDLQKRFTKEFAEIEQIKRKVSDSSLKLETLFQSLQQRAFAGELFGAESVEVDLLKTAVL